VRSRTVRTTRLAQHCYESGLAHAAAEPIVLIHGNASSGRFFEDLMAALLDFAMVAPDMRGYGASEAAMVDATRGLRDYADDVEALVEALGFQHFHLLGWSLGGNIAMQYVLDHPQRVLSLTLHATGSPYGFGSTHGADGRPNYEDCAGSGGGLINPEVRARYETKDFSADSPFSPRSGLRQFILKPPFQLPPEREDAMVEQMLMMVIGDRYYPGDSAPSSNWPFSAPGVYGSNNALSPRYCDESGLAELRGGPPILWVRGADDQIVSDSSLADPGTLGKLGLIPGWPGEAIYPPQPMLAQVRAVLDRYAATGGSYREEVFADCGHSPLWEHPERFRTLFTEFVRATSQAPATAVPPDQAPEPVLGPEPALERTSAPVARRPAGLLRRLLGRR
jgi:pimeloyl-ACP methyl ester carboxylesterase